MPKKGRPKKKEMDKAAPSDRIKCDICNVTFIRSGRTNHNSTKIHKLFEKMSTPERIKILSKNKKTDIDSETEISRDDNDDNYENSQKGGNKNLTDINDNVKNNNRNIFQGTAKQVQERIKNLAKF